MLQKSGTVGIEAIIIASQLRWVGHIARMPDERIPNRSSMVSCHLVNVLGADPCCATRTDLRTASGHAVRHRGDCDLFYQPITVAYAYVYLHNSTVRRVVLIGDTRSYQDGGGGGAAISDRLMQKQKYD